MPSICTKSLSAALAVMLTGCGLGSVGGQPSSTALSKVAYHAYGDSITAGATLSDPSTQAYPVLVGTHYGITYADLAISGDQACDVPTRQIFANADSPSLSNAVTYSLLIGTNDVDVKGVGAYEAVFLQCHQAAVAWLALPVEYKVLANSATVTTTGAGHRDTTNNWNAWMLTALGSSVSFPITTTADGPLYTWPRIEDGNPATYTYALDGKVLGTGTAQTTPVIITQNGSNNSLAFLRIPNVPAGSHVITFTKTSSDAAGVSIVGVGAPPAPGTKVSGTMPTVLLGTIPFQVHGGTQGAACSISDAPCLEYIKDVQADVDLFTGDGLTIRLFDTRQYMFATTSEMNDALHPNVLGQVELSHAVESVF